MLDMKKTKDSNQKIRIAENAIYYYKRSLSVYSDNGPVLNNMGTLYYELKNYDTAISFIQKAHEKGAITEVSYFNLAAIYYFKGDTQNAILNFEQSIAADPKYRNSYDQLSKVYFELGQHQEALEVNFRTLIRFPSERINIMQIGQHIAEDQFGVGTYYYIDLLRDRGFIDASLHDQLKNKLPPQSEN